MQIERHIFGNRRGYATLARSAGVDAEACRQLESAAFGFGQTNDPRFAQSLSAQPVFFVRELPGNRRSLTRVLEGQADDNGRPTLLLATAIVSRPEWDQKLVGNVRCLLDRPELWKWDGTSNLAAIRLSPCPSPRTIQPELAAKLLTVISEIDYRQPLGQQIVVSINEYGVKELAVLEILIPPAARSGLSIACGSLNAQFPATVNAPSALAASQAPTFRNSGLLSDLSPYAKFLADAGLLSGVIPLEKIMTYRGFGSASPPAIPANSRLNQPAPTRSRLVPLLVGVVAMSLMASFASYLVAHAQAQNTIQALQAKADAQHSQLKTEIDGLKDAIGQANKRTSDSVTEVRTQMENNLKVAIATLDQRVDRLRQQVAESDGQIRDLTQKVESFQQQIKNPPPKPAASQATHSVQKGQP